MADPLASDPSSLSPVEERAAYREMALLRRLDERLAWLYGSGAISAALPLGLGREAVVAGLRQAFGSGDQVVAGGAALGFIAAAAEGRLSSLVGEIMGTGAGASAGVGGPLPTALLGRTVLHLDAPADILSAAAVGVALACRHRSDGSVGWCILEATGRGAAGGREWGRRLPVPLVIVTLHQASVSAGPEPVAAIDGGDLGAVTRAARRAREAARREARLQSFDIMVDLFTAHSLPDPGRHGRTDTGEPRDPLRRLRSGLLARGLSGADEIERFDGEAAELVASVVARVTLAQGPS